MFLNRCPKLDELDAFVQDAQSKRIARHLLRCPSCRSKFEELYRDANLLAELRGVASDSLEQCVRERVHAICRMAIAKGNERSSGEKSKRHPRNGDTA